MDRIQQLMRGMPGGGMGAPSDGPLPDCSEKVHVSSLALLKMLKHGRAGVPMEVMGLMLGQFVDDILSIVLMYLPCHNLVHL